MRTRRSPAKQVGGRAPRDLLNEIAEHRQRELVARQLHATHYPLLNFGPYQKGQGRFFLGLQRLRDGKEPAAIELGVPVPQGHWLGCNANPPTSHHVDLGLQSVCDIPVQLCLATSVTYWEMEFTVSDLLCNESLETMLHHGDVDEDLEDDLEFTCINGANPTFKAHLGDLITFDDHRYVFLVVKTNKRLVEDFDRRSFIDPFETAAIPPNLPSSPSPARKQSKSKSKVPPARKQSKSKSKVPPERTPSRVSPRTLKSPPAAQLPHSPRQRQPHPDVGEDTKPPAKPTLPPTGVVGETKPSPKRMAPSMTSAKLPQVTPDKKKQKDSDADSDATDSDATVPMKD
jgi:hypothetical protein